MGVRLVKTMDILDVVVGCPVDIQVARQLST